jgi:hypothetical protein
MRLRPGGAPSVPYTQLVEPQRNPTLETLIQVSYKLPPYVGLSGDSDR